MRVFSKVALGISRRKVLSHIPSGGLTLIHAQIIIAIDETTRETGEENADLELGHIGMTLDDAPLVTVAIEEEQTIGLAQGDTGLIEQTVVETNILALCLGGYLPRRLS